MDDSSLAAKGRLDSAAGDPDLAAVGLCVGVKARVGVGHQFVFRFGDLDDVMRVLGLLLCLDIQLTIIERNANVLTAKDR